VAVPPRPFPAELRDPDLLPLPRRPSDIAAACWALAGVAIVAWLVAALAACAGADPGTPVPPGRVSAPPPPMAADDASLLTGTTWTWQATQAREGTRVAPDAPERYTLVFQPGGRVDVRADCNRGSGSYVLDGEALRFGPIALTKMMCPPGSRDGEFLKGLAAVAGRKWSGNDLVLTLAGDAGAMRFATARR
jgi:heat shock protein HslJ